MNTVTLSLEDYNRLRDRSALLTEIESNAKTIFKSANSCYGRNFYMAVEESEVIVEIKKTINHNKENYESTISFLETTIKKYQELVLNQEKELEKKRKSFWG